MDHLLEYVHLIATWRLLHLIRRIDNRWPFSISFDHFHSAHALIMHVQTQIYCAKLAPTAYSPLYRVLVDSSNLRLLFRCNTACMYSCRPSLSCLFLGRNVTLARKTTRLVRLRMAWACTPMRLWFMPALLKVWKSLPTISVCKSRLFMLLWGWWWRATALLFSKCIVLQICIWRVTAMLLWLITL